ncbi:alpha/beta fold hydrolase [Saccharopolyspora shandongensis]|uniref:alpha/beta hydrolase n=1 Tax=Saccharopolyspora shandongensis TaxID=418495 RepID=UPI00342CBB4B
MPSPTVVRSSLAAVGLPLLLVLGACAQQAPAPAKPSAELARFYDQELTFGPCEGYATTPADEQLFAGGKGFECARLQVPLNYDDPNGETAQIAMLRVPARGESMGSLLLNSGGPGGPGMNFAASTAAALAQSPVTERFDLIGFDPRGVGATTPAIECFSNEQYLNGEAQTEFVFTAGNWTEADSRQLVDQCAQRSGGQQTLASVSTRDTIRDMDVLRAAPGEEKLNFLGQSYGTRVGALYAEAFPQNVRAMVLDGAVDPDLGQERRLSQYAGFQRSFEAMAADCATRPDCPLGTDPARATETFQNIVRPLLDRPITFGNGRQFTYNDAIAAVVSALYSQEVRPAITKGLVELQAGNPDRLNRLAQLFSGRGPDDSGSNFNSANYAISCMDEERRTPEQANDFRRRIYQAAPFADPGRDADEARDSCEFWPAEPKPAYPFPDLVEGLPQTLTISITGDPSTPYDAGVNLAKSLGCSMLTVEGEQHTVAATGANACVNGFVADYLVTLRTSPADARCTL